MSKEFKVEFIPASTMPITYDESKCIGCNRCVNVCQCDILFPTNKMSQFGYLSFAASARAIAG